MFGALIAILAAGPTGELRATFIGNMGVHVTDGRVAILSDFPYQSGAFGYMEWSKSLVPSGPAPLCVITHSHDDHFAPRLAKDFCGSVLGPKDVVSAGGVAALDLKDEVRWEGISIRPRATPHGRLEHYSYVIEWGGTRLFFSGDTESTDALLAARDLDAAFVSPWLLQAVEKQGRKIDARRVVVYHHRAGEAVPDVQGRLVPRPGDVLSLAAVAKTSRAGSGPLGLAPHRVPQRLNVLALGQ